MVAFFRKDLTKEAEPLVLRHEKTVLRRQAGPIRYEPANQGVVYRAHAVDTSRPLGPGLPRDASDTAGLAPQADREKARHEQMAQTRAPAYDYGHRPPGHPYG